MKQSQTATLVALLYLLGSGAAAAELDATFADTARSYRKTARGDFATKSFIAEANVTVRGGGGDGSAFFGLGKGEPNANDYREPSTQPAIFLRLAPSDFAAGALKAGETTIAGPGDGTHRVRLTWDAAKRRALFEVDGKYALTVSGEGVDFADAGHLFVGGAKGVRFTGFTVAAASDAEIQAARFGDTFGNDPTAGTWLPPTGEQVEASPHMRPLVCWYQGTKLAATRGFTDGALQTANTRWTCTVRGNAPEREVTFKLVEGDAREAGVAVAFDFTDWSRDNYVLVPGVIYNGNRFHSLGGGYMAGFPRSMFFNPRQPLTMSNSPRLSVEAGKASKIELLTGNATTPAICVYQPARKRGFILLCEQNTRFGNNGLFIEENAAQDRATLVVSAPGVREQAAGFGGFSPSGDRGASWQAGDDLTLKLRVYEFDADGIPALLEKFNTVRKDLTGPNHPRNLVSMSKLAEVIAPLFTRRWMTMPVGNYYRMENSDHFQLGWVSGFMQTPLLVLDTPLERERMGQQFDFVIGKLQGKSGFFYGGITADGKLRAERSLDGRLFALTRKNTDTLLAFGKFFQILKAQGHADFIQPAWEDAYRRLAQAFVTCWDKYGEFGNYVDPATGEVAVYNTTSGAIAPAGLVLAARYFDEPKFLRVAKAAARFYYDRDVVGLGLTSGHVADTGQDPDSESAGGLLESLLALYWATGDRAWLDRARTGAALLATWTLSYDYAFPPQSDIARLGGHMAGAVFANTQNKHGAPGICTASGDYLFKLYRATGDVRYADLIRDIHHASAEATEMPGHPTCGMGPGSSVERIQTSDAEGRGNTGNIGKGSDNAWTELNAWMMAIELPGIYVQTDTDQFYTFDSVQVKRDGATLTITNPTTYPANVSILAETAEQAKQPLDYVAYLKWPKVEIPPGQTRKVAIGPDGKPTVVP